MPATLGEKEIHRLEIQIAEINNSLKFIKWIGVFLAASAVGFLTLALGVAHRAGQIEASIASLQRDTAETRKDIKDESKAQSANAARMLESLDQIHKALAQRTEQPKTTH